MTLKFISKFILISFIAFSIVLATILSLPFGFKTINTGAALNYQRAVTITSTSIAAYTDYQVKISFDTSNLIASGKMRSDCGDIRTTDSALITNYNHFLEGPCNSINTVLWVKIPSIAANSTSTFAIQYGDSTLTSISNGVNTMEKYESGATAPTCALSGVAAWDSVNKWIRLTGTVANTFGLCEWIYNPGDGYNIKYEVWSGGGTGADGVWNYAYARTSPVEEDIVDRGYSFTADEFQDRICFTKSTISNGAGVSCNATIPVLDNSTWKTFDVKHSGRNAVISLNGTVYVSASDNVDITKNRDLFGIGSRTGGQTNEHRIRNVIVSKYDLGITTVLGGENQSNSFLSFIIRNSTDTANLNTCDMGTVSTTIVSNCSYRLKVSTNAQNGFTLSMRASGALTNPSYAVNNAAPGTGGGGGSDISNLTAGSENYGVLITKGSTTSGTTALTSAFNAGLTNKIKYDYVSTAPMMTATGSNSPNPTDTVNTTLISHFFNTSGNTPPGNYTQSIVYTVSPSF